MSLARRARNNANAPGGTKVFPYSIVCYDSLRLLRNN